MKSFEVLNAPASWGAIDFLSDLHLSPSTPKTLAALRRHLHDTPADAVFLLGDIFEVWIGDDARLEEGFEAACLALLREAAGIRPLFFMAGNRDFLLGDAMARDAGLRLLPDPLVLQACGQRLLLSHGDALCLDDQAYQRFRAQVRDPDWQEQFLTQPLEARRTIGRQMREASERAKRQQSPELWADVDADAARDWLGLAQCQVLLHGHTHRPAVHDLGAGMSRWVLSDWDLEGAPPRGDVLRLSTSGLQRLPLPAA